MADLDTIMSERGNDSAPEQEATHVEQPQTRDDGRDEQGRFASQQPAPEAPPTESQEQRPPDGFIPIQALDARLAKQQERYEAMLRERDAQFQRQLQAFQPQQPPAAPKPPPDQFEDFGGAVNYQVQPQIREAINPLQEQLMFNARLAAQALHGEEKFNAAVSAFDDAAATGRIDPRDYQRVRNSPNPFHEAVQWHKRESALKTYGDDPEAAINAEVERRLAARTQQPPASQAAPPVMPTSFAGTRNAGPASAPAYGGPRPLSDIMGGR
jgi:hypothetical protein